ncbi:MAG: hypothetical protein AAFV53_05820 [Myxococcota bacterium]
MKFTKYGLGLSVFGISALLLAGFLSKANADDDDSDDDDVAYEIWASDQSNSVSGAAARGVEGSFLWIYDSEDVKVQLDGGSTATPLSCDGDADSVGPCDLLDVFPGTLKQIDEDGETDVTLADLPQFGRLHGMLEDPQNRYVTVNIFAVGGGYVGIIDTQAKEAIALFRVTETNTSNKRSVHMSEWSLDGSAILIANLHGKVLERIDITRDRWGNITDAVFNKSASLGVGKDMVITEEATAFSGLNQQGNPLIGSVAGEYSADAFADTTPEGFCKENGCNDDPAGGDAENGDGTEGGRPNNLIICPITSENDNVYITMGGGGLIIADLTATPMTIVGEYGNEVVNGAGCGGARVQEEIWLNAGVSASAAGATQSTFTMYAIDDTAFDDHPGENLPEPTVVYRDTDTNTSTLGSTVGASANTTGQLPATTTRRDAHGAVETINEQYVHNVDRIQNVVEVFDTDTLERTTYDLTSADGQGEGTGPCAAASVTDDEDLPTNDPAPDLVEATPDGKFLVVAFRGPIPVSVTHSAQGSCPGVGIVELTDGGASGRLAGVLRTTNTIDDTDVSAPGGHPYTGSEHSDIHGATAILKNGFPFDYLDDTRAGDNRFWVSEGGEYFISGDGVTGQFSTTNTSLWLLKAAYLYDLRYLSGWLDYGAFFWTAYFAGVL